MEKKFRLPKTFALAWLEALRSGKYIQSKGMLALPLFVTTQPPTDIELNNFGFCCLGVAGHICGNPISDLTTGYLYHDKGPELVNIPKELYISCKSDISLKEHQMIKVLATLNDGIDRTSILSGLIVRPDMSTRIDESLSIGKDFRFKFSEIADFIEDNTEFYEEEEK